MQDNGVVKTVTQKQLNEVLQKSVINSTNYIMNKMLFSRNLKRTKVYFQNFIHSKENSGNKRYKCEFTINTFP